MEVAQHIEALQNSGDRLGRAVEVTGTGAGVATCPGWTVRDLLDHIGGVHRWATSFIRTGRLDPTTAEERSALFAPGPVDGLVDWYRNGLAALVDALTTADPGMGCWTFLPAPSPLAFWARRQAHETSIHCVDAEVTARLQSTFLTDLAVDGIDELLTGFIVRPQGRLVADAPLTLAVRAVDAERSWTVHIGPGGRTVSPGASDADCTVSGRAVDLYVDLWNRPVAPGAVTIDGDARVMDRWRADATVN